MIFVLVVTGSMAALTWMLGWWGVLVAASIVGGVFRQEGGGGWHVALAAALAWGALLVVNAVSGSLSTVSETLGGVMRVPGPLLVVLTLVFPALLAWSAATVAAQACRVALDRPPRERR